MTVYMSGESVIIGGVEYFTNTGDQTWSLTTNDNITYRYEVRSGDHYCDASWCDPITSERSEIEGTARFSANATVNISYEFMMEPGQANTADWLIMGQLHDMGVLSPPYAAAMYGENMQIILRDDNNNEINIYADPNPIQRGHWYSMLIQFHGAADSSGRVKVWRNNVQIVNYSGILGAGTGTYWKNGIYRNEAPESIAINYRNLYINDTPNTLLTVDMITR